ncbi:DUF6920 family protein [Alienimonas sp. DA493]|uniref:DUF6920 family protein n=1 Tax=Alienimonas sp. DA493 TaxID=3373605 RepID=UPI0037548DD7
MTAAPSPSARNPFLAGLVCGGVGAAAAYGALRGGGAALWCVRRRRRLRRLVAPDREIATPAGHGDGALPPPVATYLHRVGVRDVPAPAVVELRHEGELNLAEMGPEARWRPFTSRQWVATVRPGFLWDAAVSAAPFVPVRVCDAYLGGSGLLEARLFGVVPVASADGPLLAEAELMRYLAEAPWSPWGLRPSSRLRWSPDGERAAWATLRDGMMEVRLQFRFGEDGLVESVRANARTRLVGGVPVPTPWIGRFDRYRRRGGVLVPTLGETAWLEPGGKRPYWRGRLTRLAFCRDARRAVRTRTFGTQAVYETLPQQHNGDRHDPCNR